MIPTGNRYRERTWDLLQTLLRPLGVQPRALDFGSGEGWFAARMLSAKQAGEVVAVDVKRREQVLVEPTLYAGDRLPFEAASFDLCYSVDVLHHCADPLAAIDDLLRVSRRFVLIKDHVSGGLVDRIVLSVLDELGNRRFGIPSPHNYQRGRNWDEHIRAQRWTLRAYIWPAPVHTGTLGALTNRLQYVALYERTGRSS